jgi:hypothetical protein
MADFTPKVRRFLKDAGWQIHGPGKGDHEKWINPATGAKVTVDNKIRSRHTANGILKEAGLGKKF